MNNPVLIAILSVVILFSACATPGKPSNTSVVTTKDDALTIHSFAATPDAPVPDQLTSLTLRLENTGGATATDLQIKLYNVLFEGPQSWTFVNGDRWMDIGDLSPPDDTIALKGDAREIVWDLRAPDIDRGISRTWQLYARTHFGYESTAISDIVLMSETQYRQENAKPTQIKADNTNGPIQITFRSRSPVVISATAKSFQICASITNKGDGTPFLPSSSYADLYATEAPRIENRLDVELEAGPFSVTEPTKTIQLIGNTADVCFTVEVSNEDITPQATVPISLTSTYNYYQDSVATITVSR